MNTGEFVTSCAWMIIPVIGFVYVRVESAILRRAGVPPIEQQIGSLEGSEHQVKSPANARKAA